MGVETTTTTYKKLKYSDLQNLAYDFLDTYTDGILPINLSKIINQINNVQLLKYSKFAKLHHMEMPEVISWLQSEDGALWYQSSSDSYILLYNDTIKSKERIRFTIAHELGHYVLKHNEMTDKTIISRYSLTSEEYSDFEREANFFAKHLLVPFPVLGNYSQFFHVMNADFISYNFNVSYTVAMNVINNLQNMYKTGLVKVGHSVEHRFSTYILTDQSTRICRTCNCKIFRNDGYCHICSTEQYEGVTSISAFLENKLKESTSRVKYRSIELDERGLPHKCPKCENEELDSAGYCNICGLYIKNECVGHYDSNISGLGYTIPIENFLEDPEQGCGAILEGNSRYCPRCGGKSSFYYQGILTNWEIEKKEYDEMPF